jgi:hypothetical protein
MEYSNYIKIPLPSRLYKAMVWDAVGATFIDTNYDILEQKHLVMNKNGSLSETSEYEMYFAKKIVPSELAFIKIIQIASEQQRDPKAVEYTKMVGGDDSAEEEVGNNTLLV